eukprot:CAMPEP_0113936996 /NCGR_PEP_ID=MMETSP1339-20121228/3717_1 /TAXON_ID=94617 /ORGANISM="Fibrocapsa japonica" /LENGTH=481 /DNA_ID=CAMNT_0000939595 /DNA_START=81 /DNA_END=1526 /DNA_ORIENTATION=- /assembly_acc=CAM_ASM_000762
MIMELLAIGVAYKACGIWFGSALSEHRSKQNGWEAESEESLAVFEPDFAFHSKRRHFFKKKKSLRRIRRQERNATRTNEESKAIVPINKVPTIPLKVMVFISDTGGGHRASAQALTAAIDEVYPGQFQFDVVDIWRYYSVPPFNTLVESYQFAAKNPWAWQIMFANANFPPTRHIFQELGSATSYKKFEEAMFKDGGYDLVLSLHPLCQNLPLRILYAKEEKTGERPPFMTVVTDLGGAHATWFDPRADLCFVPSAPVRRMALMERMDPNQLRQHGLPIRPAFSKAPMTKADLRNELGMKQVIKSVLVVGGGDGVGGLKSIASTLINALGHEDSGLQAAQVVVVCGSNKSLKKEMEEESWPSKVNVLVQGFVSNMHEWMGACDCLITKAGPGTIAEAAICGLPVMLSAYLPGQEEGNVSFVIKNGFGQFSDKPKIIAETVRGWLQDEDELKQLSTNARAVGQPSATYDIAREIGEYMGLKK